MGGRSPRAAARSFGLRGMTPTSASNREPACDRSGIDCSELDLAGRVGGLRADGDQRRVRTAKIETRITGVLLRLVPFPLFENPEDAEEATQIPAPAVAGSSTRGLILHKLIEELLTANCKAAFSKSSGVRLRCWANSASNQSMTPRRE